MTEQNVVDRCDAVGGDSVYVWSIHDEEAGRHVLGFDLRDVFLALGPAFTCRRWCVVSLDAFGDDRVGAFCDAVEAGGRGGVWVTAAEGLDLAAHISQTVDGVVVGVSAASPPADVPPADLDLARFPQGKADLAVVAVDGSFFEVYSKDEGVGAALQASFRDVRARDAAAYFAQP